MKGILTGREEFLYPDTELGELRQEYVFSAAANGKKGIQILLEASGEEIELEWDLPELSVELYQMKAIPVEYNTGKWSSAGRKHGGRKLGRQYGRICDTKSSVFCL